MAEHGTDVGFAENCTMSVRTGDAVNSPPFVILVQARVGAPNTVHERDSILTRITARPVRLNVAVVLDDWAIGSLSLFLVD